MTNQSKIGRNGFALREASNGEMLLTVREAGEGLLLLSSEADEMNEYLHAVRNGMPIETLRDMAAWNAEVEEDDVPTVSQQWASEPVIADTTGEYRERAGSTGLLALRLATLREEPLAELARCSTAAEVLSFVRGYSGLFVEGYTAEPRNAYRHHELAWKVCKVMWDIAQPSNYVELELLCGLWAEVCSELVHSEGLCLNCYLETEEDSESCSFDKANVVELCADRVSHRGIMPFPLAEHLADLCGSLLGAWEYSQDGDNEWFRFTK